MNTSQAFQNPQKYAELVTLGSERGTVFKINIANREVFTLFHTGASRSVMSGETFRKLNLDNRDLDIKNLPMVVGENGTSLGAIVHGPLSPVLLLTTHPSMYSLTDLPEVYGQ